MIGRFLYNVFYWSYDRGSWQWDVSCLVFLVVIFATPPDFLDGYTRRPLEPGQIHQAILGFFGAFWR